MHLDKIFDFSNALPKNHLDVSSADEVEITYTERENSSVIHPQKIKKTRLESNWDHDDGPSVNQPTDSVSVYVQFQIIEI